MNADEVLHSPFDIATHKNTFVHYFEVIIRDNGVVEYAVPSHQEKLIAVACEMLSVSRQELYDMCPSEYYFDFVQWLCNVSGCCSLWDVHSVFPDKLTNEQLVTLKKLADAGLYKGRIGK